MPLSRFEGVLAAVRQNLGAGRAAQAQAALQRALQRDAADAGLNGAMAVVQARLGEVQRAVYFAARAARACPEQPHCLADFASALVETGRTDEGLREFEALVSREGSRPWLLVSAACVVRAAGRYVGAARLMELALEAGGGDAALGPSAINDWMNGGQGMAGAALAARLSQRNPEHVDFAGLRAYLANYPDHAGDVVGFHRTFGEMLQRTVPARTGGHSGSRDPLRRIRVGLLSPDLRLSAVAFFIEPFFTHRDRGAFELFGYSVALKEDAVGARLRGEADGWLHQPEWTDEQIAAAVERDRVDVLVDLAGLTGYSRLGVMAMRPAPVSLTYLGYPNTTGLKTIDWRIVDALTDPPGSESDSTERLARMDGCFVCYRPREGFPSVAERGAGPVTFGSFNNLLKFNPGVARLWGRVLDVVPGARLVMKAPQLGDPGARAEVVKTFQGAGADLSRIELLAPAPGLREHLEAYARVDIALDTFPYCGTTTTCEALLMGVPVVTLRGDSHRGRVGQSLLSAVGVPELVALDEDGYVGLAARLAADRGALRAMRVGLRGKLLGSALCDGPGWCRRFESVLRGAWGAYCAGHGSDDRRSV